MTKLKNNFNLNLFQFQICLYFYLQFKNLKCQTKTLIYLNSNRKFNDKIKRRVIYLILRRHNAICWKLKRFNDFWKFHLQILIMSFILLCWFTLYTSAFDIKLVIYHRILFAILLCGFILLLSFLFYTVSLASYQVSI